jgi:glycosyltransferase involved in cell wall biosynthesis
MRPTGTRSQPSADRPQQRFADLLFIGGAVLRPVDFLKALKNAVLWARVVRSTQTLKLWSEHFDSDYYLSSYPDVASRSIDPTLHFLFYGNQERRAPSASFATGEYLARYPDVAETGINALLHYVLFGKAEGRTLTDTPQANTTTAVAARQGTRSIESASQIAQPAVTPEIQPRVLNNYWLQDRPILSIVIPCYNYGAFVEEAVRSVLAQTFKDIEVIVVDGGSDDPHTLDNLRRLEALKLPGVSVYYRDRRRLAGDNRNFGIARARGRYVGCLDADDMLRATYCEVALFLAEGYGYGLIYSSLQCFGESTFRWLLTDASFPEIVARNQVSTTAIFRRADWAHSGGYRDWPPGTEYVPEDWELWARLLGLGCRPKSIREPLYLYRVHHKGITGSSDMDPDRQSGAIREAMGDLLKEYVLEPEAPLHILNRWTNFDKSDHDPRPGFLLALPFVTVGGADTLLHSLAEEVTRRGFRLVVITSLVLPDAVPDQVRSFETLTPHVYPLGGLFHDAGMAEEFLCRLIKRYRVSHLFFAGCELAYHLLPRLRLESPSLVVVDQLFNDQVHAPNNRRYREFIDATVVPSGALEASLRRMTPENPGAIHIVPHAVQACGANLRLPREIRAEFSLPQDKVIVGFFGRLSPEKGGLIFVDIARALAHDDNLFFVMTGEGPERQAIMEAIERSGLRPRFYTPGFVDDVRPLLCAADIVVVPSILDGMPLVVLEAQAHERPVVASAVGSIPTIIADGETGRLCPAGDVSAFANQIMLLAKDPALRTFVGRAAARAVNEHHNHEKMLHAYFNVFDSARLRRELSYEPTAR